MGEFDGALALAVRLIKKKGKLVKLARLKDGPPADPKKPWRPTAAQKIEYEVSAVFFSFPADRPDGRRRWAGDQLCLIAAADPGLKPADKPAIVPQQHDVLEFNGKTYMFIAVTETAPAGDDIYYQGLVRVWPQRST